MSPVSITRYTTLREPLYCLFNGPQLCCVLAGQTTAPMNDFSPAPTLAAAMELSPETHVLAHPIVMTRCECLCEALLRELAHVPESAEEM